MSSFFDRLRNRSKGAPIMDQAMQTMLGINPNAYCAKENGQSVFLEDHRDPDDRMFRLEYQCTGDGQGTRVFVRYNPWSPANPATPDDLPILDTHFYRGEICIGDKSHGHGGYELGYAVLRARHWCVCYSLLREHGVHVLRQVEPEW